MLTISSLSPRALEIVAENRITREDVPRAFEALNRLLETSSEIDILADVRGHPSINPAILWEELKHIGDMFRMVRSLGRVALIADAEWIRAVGKIESFLIPGVTYEVFTREQASHARAWLLRETDEAHPR